jgi:hypothetical protein
MLKYALYRSIRECLPNCHDLEDLEQRLRKQDIEVRFRTDAETGQKIGISFRYQNEAFKGSDIDSDLSLHQIQKKLEQQEKLTQWTNEKLVQKQELDRHEKQEKEMSQRQRELSQEKTLREQVRHVPRLRIR